MVFQMENYISIKRDCMDKILEIKNLSAGYDNKKIISDINLSVKNGQSIAIVGESGGGKTTLVKAVTNMCDIYSGDILFEGKSIVNISKKEIRENRKHIQMIIQDSHSAFNPSMSIRDYIKEPMKNFYKYDDKKCLEKTKELLNLVSLDESVLDRSPNSLSGGQRQRIAIIGALSVNPKLLICDEITSALDVSVGKQIMELLDYIKSKTNMTIIYISHDLALMASASDEIFIMNDGKIVEQISSKDLKKSQNIYTRKLLDATYVID